MRTLVFLGLGLAALTVAFALAHLAVMPNKLTLDGPSWYAAQFLYRGWGPLLGPIEGATLLVSLALLWRTRGEQPAFA